MAEVELALAVLSDDGCPLFGDTRDAAIEDEEARDG